MGLLLLATAPAAEADFGVESFSSQATDAAGAPYTPAGGHPHQNAIEFSIPLADGETEPEQSLKGTYLMPAPGLIANPAAAARCRVGDLHAEQCPPGSRVGLAEITRNGKAQSSPLYNLVPERGYPAQFGFLVDELAPVLLSVFPRPRTDSYSLTLATPNLPAESGASGLIAKLCSFGVEGDGLGEPFRCGSSTDFDGAPFLSGSLDCSLAQIAGIAIDSAEHAGALRELGVPDLSDPDWKTSTFIGPAASGCEDPRLAEQFDPAITTEPLQLPAGGPLQAEQPTGLRVGLDFPQSNDPTDPESELDPSLPQAPSPKEITVRFPVGLTFSPAAADGLGACSDLASAPAGDQVHYENTQPVRCPDASKIGTATATSPLLATRNPISDDVTGAEAVPGAVYVLQPHPGDLPLGGNGDGRFRLLIVLASPGRGVNVKLPGIATADRDSGQITARFTESPQLPASHLSVELKPGPRAPFTTPVTCGSFLTTTDFVPWSAPGTPNANPTAGFDLGSGPGGSACASTPSQRPFAPALASAGTDSAEAGAASPFTLELARPDGDQELGSLNFTAPPGFTAKLKGVASCSDAAIAAAQRKSGAEEQANPSCPAASQLGSVTAGAGAGPNPYYTSGKAYLAGPYEGAPLSFAFITPALAGSFDLGNIVFRAGAYLDLSTAQVTVKTDQLPRILSGIPLRLRSIVIRLDRPNFTLNPTDCDPMSVSATVNGSNGATATPAAFFQAGGCEDLTFKPRLALEFLDNLARNGHPSVRATLRARPGEAGIAATTITLPEGELLDLRHLGALCARGLPPERCPGASRIGGARIWTPLLAGPLQGPIYLRQPDGRLPALVADLRGGGLRFVVRGHTSAPPGRLRIHFPALPDAPLSKALITLAGGARGIFVNSESLCNHPRRAAVGLTAHNNKQRQLRPKLRLRGRC